MMAKEGLPMAYERLGYISNQQNGNIGTYIPTGVKNNGLSEYSLKLSFVSEKIGFNGCFISSKNDKILINTFTYINILYNNTTFGQSVPGKEIKYIEKNKEYFAFDGFKKTYDRQEFESSELILFAQINSQNRLSSFLGVYGNKVHVENVKIKLDKKLVRNFIPAKRKSDGVIGMYDLVGRKFYTSPNGVAFTGGVSRRLYILMPSYGERRAA